MGKLDEKKKIKRESLFSAAFSLFTSQGINETSVSDIVKKASMAKGTFYLYFKDKFDLRDKLIASKATQLFQRAAEDLENQTLGTFEEKVIFIADSVINQLNDDKMLLKFLSKNLSWGVFHNALMIEIEETGGYSFYDGYNILLAQSGRHFRNSDLMLYMVVELISSTCYSVILNHEPVSLEELKPELFGVIEDIIHRQEIS